MPKLKCEVKECKYNYETMCSKRAIDVDGIDSKNKNDTKCSSFVYRNLNDINFEFSKFENEPTPTTEVYCDVIKCVFERGQKCHADRIVIKQMTSNSINQPTSTSTLCETFESID